MHDAYAISGGAAFWHNICLRYSKPRHIHTLMDNIFSNSCNTLMGKARSEAIKHNMGKITPETILLALLDDEESAAYKAI